jgi:hypothetical protein
MRKERRAILWLIASGRITAAEAERLLAVSNHGREELWVIAACVAICTMQLIVPSRFAHMLPDNIPTLHHVLSVLTFLLGGIS